MRPRGRSCAAGNVINFPGLSITQVPASTFTLVYTKNAHSHEICALEDACGDSNELLAGPAPGARRDLSSGRRWRWRCRRCWPPPAGHSLAPGLVRGLHVLIVLPHHGLIVRHTHLGREPAATKGEARSGTQRAARRPCTRKAQHPTPFTQKAPRTNGINQTNASPGAAEVQCLPLEVLQVFVFAHQVDVPPALR